MTYKYKARIKAMKPEALENERQHEVKTAGIIIIAACAGMVGVIFLGLMLL